MKSTIVTFALFAVTFGAPVRRQGGNFQTFTGALGGIAATPVQDSGNPDRPFQVKGDTFVNIGAALARSCDQQFNACANAANGGDETLSVAQCSAQKDQCDAGSQSGAAAQGSAQAGSAGNINANDGGNNAASSNNAGGDVSELGNAASCV